MTFPTREYKGFTIELVPDPDPQNPEDWGDGPAYLLHYHRSFSWHADKHDLPTTGPKYLEWLGREHYEVPEDEREWHVFPLESYIHSGVVLAFENQGSFPDRRWDVSRCGSIVVKKSELWDGADAQVVAKQHLDTWNMCLQGDVWGYKVLDAEGTDLTDEDEITASWNNYGEGDAFEAAQEAIDDYLRRRAAESSPEDYSWVTSEMFDNALEALVDEMTVAELLATPGIREILNEELNNAVLERLEGEREDA